MKTEVRLFGNGTPYIALEFDNNRLCTNVEDDTERLLIQSILKNGAKVHIHGGVDKDGRNYTRLVLMPEINQSIEDILKPEEKKKEQNESTKLEDCFKIAAISNTESSDLPKSPGYLR